MHSHFLFQLSHGVTLPVEEAAWHVFDDMLMCMWVCMISLKTVSSGKGVLKMRKETSFHIRDF